MWRTGEPYKWVCKPLHLHITLTVSPAHFSPGLTSELSSVWCKGENRLHKLFQNWRDQGQKVWHVVIFLSWLPVIQHIIDLAIPQIAFFIPLMSEVRECFSYGADDSHVLLHLSSGRWVITHQKHVLLGEEYKVVNGIIIRKMSSPVSLYLVFAHSFLTFSRKRERLAHTPGPGGMGAPLFINAGWTSWSRQHVSARLWAPLLTEWAFISQELTTAVFLVDDLWM